MDRQELINEYHGLLIKYPEFDYNYANEIKTYFENCDSNNLSFLRKKYKIDTIIKPQDIFGKVIDIMNWVHNQLFCIGESVRPQETNSLSILNERKKGNLICLYQAIVMNEILLSINIKSRVVKCMPCNFDGDFHVVVIVYIDEFHKWILFDPTFNTYFVDKKNIPLTIDEIRNNYRTCDPNEMDIRFKKIQIKKEWTLVLYGMIFETYDEWYKVYMLKNIFRFLTPTKSKFGYMTKKDDKVIFLNPKGFSVKNEYDKIGTSENIYTNNMNLFI
jgi:hypothetical protein